MNHYLKISKFLNSYDVIHTVYILCILNKDWVGVGLMEKSLQNLLVRESVIKAIRAFFDERGFHEVITPVLNEALPLEENLFSFETTWATLRLLSGQADAKVFYLPTSPESNLKKLLAQGIGNCYSIGHSFRNLESSGEWHSPEFLMLEWYREDASYLDIMVDTQELVTFVGQRVKGVERVQQTMAYGLWPKISLEQLFQEKANISLQDVCDGDALFEIARAKGYSIEDSSWSQVFDQIFLNEIDQSLPKEPFFLVDFPSRISPLCQPQKEKTYLAERFEVYMNGVELGNGNTENLDAEYVLQIFKQVAGHRSQASLSSHPYDDVFVDALRILQKTGKSYAGIGLGVERLSKLLDST